MLEARTSTPMLTSIIIIIIISIFIFAEKMHKIADISACEVLCVLYSKQAKPKTRFRLNKSRAESQPRKPNMRPGPVRVRSCPVWSRFLFKKELFSEDIPVSWVRRILTLDLRDEEFREQCNCRFANRYGILCSESMGPETVSCIYYIHNQM